MGCAGLLWMAVLPGCGRDGLPNMVAIRGTVSYQGKPLTEGTVLYLPQDPQGRQARGDVAADGTFTLTTLRNGDGAQQGSYRIVVIAYKPHPGEMTREQIEAAGGLIHREFSIPEKYTKAETSGLTDEVNRDHSGIKQLALED